MWGAAASGIGSVCIGSVSTDVRRGAPRQASGSWREERLRSSAAHGEAASLSVPRSCSGKNTLAADRSDGARGCIRGPRVQRRRRSGAQDAGIHLESDFRDHLTVSISRTDECRRDFGKSSLFRVVLRAAEPSQPQRCRGKLSGVQLPRPALPVSKNYFRFRRGTRKNLKFCFTLEKKSQN